MTKKYVGILIIAGAVIVAGGVIKLGLRPISTAAAQTVSASSCQYFSATGYNVTGEQAIATACNAMFESQWNACVAAGHGSNCTYSNQDLAFNCGMVGSSGSTTGYCLGNNTSNCIAAMTQQQLAQAVGAVCPTSAATTTTPIAPNGVLTAPAMVAVWGPTGGPPAVDPTYIQPGASYQFTDIVTGAPAGADISVNWQVACHTAQASGMALQLTTSGCGTVNSSGLYTAPTVAFAPFYTLYVRATTNAAYPILGAAGYTTTSTFAGESAGIVIQFPGAGSPSSPTQPVTPVGGGTGGTGTTTGGGSSISSQINLDLNPALQGFSAVLQGIASQANSSGAQASSPVTVSANTGGTGGGGTSTTGGSCASVAASTVASSLQTLQGLSSVLAGQNVSPAVLSSIQSLISSVAQVLTALSTCISA